MKLDDGILALLRAIALVAVTALPAAAARVVVDAQFRDRLPADPEQRLAPILEATVHVDGRFLGFTKPEGLGIIELPVGFTILGAGSALSDTTRFPSTAGYTGQSIDHMTELIVIYHAGVSVDALPPVIAGFPVKRRYVHGRYVVLEATNQISSQNLLGLLGDPHVQFIEPSYHYYPSATPPPNDPDWVSDHPDLWGLRLIKAEVAWQAFHASPIRVAVVDSGIDLTHPDLASNLWRNGMELAGSPNHDDDTPPNLCNDDINGCDFVQNDPDPQDTNGHGTQVAGIIAAVGNNSHGTVGVLWSANLIPVRVFQSLFIDPDVAARGIDYAVLSGAKVINASFAGRNSQSVALSNAITNAQNAGALLVAATGNSMSNLDVSSQAEYPAAYGHDNIVAVLATDAADQPTYGTGFGANSVDLGAPGTAIRSTTIGGGYTLSFGDSFAVPYVSGALALAWATDPTMTAQQVKALVLDHVVVVRGLAGKCLTGGRLDLSFIKAPATPPREVAPPAPTLIDVKPLPE